MTKFSVQLLKKKEVASGTKAFYFKPPRGFYWKAGQSLDMTLAIAAPDGGGNTRSFSIFTAPHEGVLGFAMRMRPSAFKNKLDTLKPGDSVRAEGPFGTMTLHKNHSRPAIFIAGGIGITPFRSIILDALERKLPHRLLLFYSNRHLADATFLDELLSVAKNSATLTVVPTLTDLSAVPEDWNGERGRFSAGFFARNLKNLVGEPIYYIAGPTAMVVAAQKILNDEGVSDDDIRTEEFVGY